jgi:hypothetical protein
MNDSMRRENKRPAGILELLRLCAPSIIHRLTTEDYASRESISAAISRELLALWKECLIAADTNRGASKQSVLARSTSVDELAGMIVARTQGKMFRPDCFTLFDGIIIQQAETAGWWLTLSPHVSFRLIMWNSDPQCAGLSKQMGDACELAGQRFRGEAPRPIVERHGQFKKMAVDELRFFLRGMRGEFATTKKTNRPPKSDDLLRHVEETIATADAGVYPYLKTYLDSLLSFLRSDQTTLQSLISAQLPQPGHLYAAWGAWEEQIQIPTFRKKLSELFPQLN